MKSILLILVAAAAEPAELQVGAVPAELPFGAVPAELPVGAVPVSTAPAATNKDVTALFPERHP